MVGICLVEDPTSHFQWLSALFCIHAIFASIQDVAVDALAIDVVPENDRGKTTAFMRSGMVLGTAIGAAGLGYILRIYGFGWAALVEASLLALLTISTFWIREHREDSFFLSGGGIQRASALVAASPNFRHIFKELWRGIMTRASILLTLAISLLYLTESLFRRVLDVHLIQNVGWTDIQLTGLKGVPGTLLTLATVFTGGWLVDRFGGRRILGACALLLLTLLIGYASLESHWGNKWLTSSFILTKSTVDALVNVCAIPLFMYLTKRGVEGSQFVFYMALSNQMDVLGASLAGLAANYTSVAGLGWICSAAVFTALILIFASSKYNYDN